MSDDDGPTRPPRRAPAWLYMLGGAVVLLVVYGFLFRRGMLDMRLWDSPVRVVIIALLGVALGWLAHRISSRPR
jgi:hypothetical protein